MEEQNIENQIPEYELSKETERYILLSRMVEKRKKVTSPNIEQAWDTFRKEKGASVSNQKHSNWRMWGSALAGAAAMLAGIVIYNSFFQYDAQDIVPANGIMAMTYDNTPQNIILQENDQIINLSDKDSVSFYTPSGNNTMQQSLFMQVDQSTPEPPRMQKLSTPRGMDFKVILPDGSEVWLNAESTIEFPSAFTKNKRYITLKGEAYFKIAHDEQAPFIVASDKIAVRVLGTEFNFKSYVSEASHVSLIKGSVEILNPNSQQTEAKLTPGQDAWYDENGNIHVDEIDIYTVTQWVNGFFYFDGLPMVDVLRELGRWYNLGVIFRNPSCMNYQIHFSASRNESIHQAIENLNRLRKVKIRIENTNLVVY